jgi:hypothetical protein
VALGGLFARIAGKTVGEAEVPPIDDPLVASQSAEVLANVRIAGQTQEQKKAEEIAARPPMTRTTTEKADGTVDIAITNAPTQNPADEVRGAGAKVHYGWLEQVVGKLDKGAQQMPDPTEGIDEKLSTREGRAQLLSEIGVEAPTLADAMGTGRLIPTAIGQQSKYRQLLDNPEKIRLAVISNRMKQLSEAAGQSRPFQGAIEGAQTQDRLAASEARQLSAQKFTERERIIDNVRQFDTSHLPSAEDAVKVYEQLYGDRWGEMKEWAEPLIRSEYYTRGLARQKGETELRIKELDEQLKEAKVANNAKEVEKLNLQIANLQSTIANRDEKKARKVGRGMALTSQTSTLLELVDDPDFDQESVSEALRVKDDALAREANRLTARRDSKRKLLTALRDKGYVDSGDPEQKAMAEFDVTEANERLREIEGERAEIGQFRQKKGSKPAAATPPPGVKGGLVNQGGTLVYTPGG